ncbi:MAG TPA: DUF3099 domain-containing protein [Mycobacteriales bacterium]|nr:DUF3099 domain-containing protein [Mycobacteriales bacterium]
MRLGRHRRDTPVITDAPASVEEQFAYRRRRYAIMMGTRIVCLILAAAFYHIVWLMALLAAGAIVLPWFAVIMANDRLPPKSGNFTHFAGDPDRALPPSSGPGRVIDN